MCIVHVLLIYLYAAIVLGVLHFYFISSRRMLHTIIQLNFPVPTIRLPIRKGIIMAQNSHLT